ncbi:MAG: BrnT family toxin [Desulfopila sp.]
MEFEYDPNKSEANKVKHGIDFKEAQALWNDPDLLEIPSKNVQDEPRYLVIGKIGNTHWSAIITYRNTSVRIFSVRRSRDNEVNYYES